MKKRILLYLELIRFDRPVGTWLLFLPCMFSLIFAREAFPEFGEIGLFFAGAFCMRSAGCIINDLWDRQLDAQVERTKNRPLASGAMSVNEAFILLFLFLYFAASLLTSLNSYAVILGVISLILVALYPLMKRITWYPQLFLGLTFNFGVLIAWASVHNDLSLLAILLYIGGICWTIGYDTIYAHQDITDDLAVGIKSTAIKFGENNSRNILFLYMGFLIIMLFAGLSIGFGLVYLVLFNVLGFVILNNVQLCDFENQLACAKEFKRNGYYGFLILIILIITTYLY